MDNTRNAAETSPASTMQFLHVHVHVSSLALCMLRPLKLHHGFSIRKLTVFIHCDWVCRSNQLHHPAPSSPRSVQSFISHLLPRSPSAVRGLIAVKPASEPSPAARWLRCSCAPRRHFRPRRTQSPPLTNILHDRGEGLPHGLFASTSSDTSPQVTRCRLPPYRRC